METQSTHNRKSSIKTRISLHYEYASAVMMGLIFPGVKQRDAIKHIESKDYSGHFSEKIRQS